MYVREKYAGWVPLVVPLGTQIMSLRAADTISLSDVIFQFVEGPWKHKMISCKINNGLQNLISSTYSYAPIINTNWARRCQEHFFVYFFPIIRQITLFQILTIFVGGLTTWSSVGLIGWRICRVKQILGALLESETLGMDKVWHGQGV